MEMLTWSQISRAFPLCSLYCCCFRGTKTDTGSRNRNTEDRAQSKLEEVDLSHGRWITTSHPNQLPSAWGKLHRVLLERSLLPPAPLLPARLLSISSRLEEVKQLA